jgi:hypothetical protein
MILRSIALAAALATAGQQSDPATGEQLAATARAHFEAGHFPEAAAGFARAHRADPQPEYLWGWAQAERKAGNCPIAVQVYRRYLEHDLTPSRIDAAEKNVLRCGYAVDEIPEPTSGTELDGLYRESPPPPEVDEPPPRHWATDPLGASLVAGGATGLVVSAGLWGGWAGARASARDAETESDYRADVQRADGLQIGAIVTTVVGAGLLAGGIIRWMIVRKEQRTQRFAVGPRRGVSGFSVRF